MEEQEENTSISLLDFCAKQMVHNWDNRRYRSQILKLLSTSNMDVIDHIVNTFRKENKLSEGILLQFLPSLCYHLNLSGCDFLRNSVLRQISFYGKNLVVLILDGCRQLSNSSLQAILQSCWKLEILSLKGCYLITDAPFISSLSPFVGLHALVSLRKLNLSRCSQLYGDFAMSVAKNCSKLSSLDISYCRNITEDALQKLFSLYYTELNVSYLPSVTDDVLSQLKPHCECLSSLSVAHTSITNQGLISVLQACSRLRVLDISYSSTLTDTTLFMLPTYTPLLSSLTLDNNHVTDQGLMSVVNSLPLTYLSIAFCSDITDASFSNIDQSMLKEIHVMWCGKLTDSTFQKLQQCKSIARIGVSGCDVSNPIRQSCAKRGVILVF